MTYKHKVLRKSSLKFAIDFVILTHNPLIYINFNDFFSVVVFDELYFLIKLESPESYY